MACTAQLIVVIETINHREHVSEVRYAECTNGTRPLRKDFVEICSLEGNPYAPVVWGRVADHVNLKWLCEPAGSKK